MLEWGARRLESRQVLYPPSQSPTTTLLRLTGRSSTACSSTARRARAALYVAQLRMRRGLRGECTKPLTRSPPGRWWARGRGDLGGRGSPFRRPDRGSAPNPPAVRKARSSSTLEQRQDLPPRTRLGRLRPDRGAIVLGLGNPPRPEYMYAVKRCACFRAVAKVRHQCDSSLTWTVSHDAKRLARWIERNPCVTVSLDSTTYRSSASFGEQLEFLST